MQDDYTRLLEAARRLRAWDTPAEVARGLTAGGFEVSDQIMTNWKTRGLSAKGVLEASRIIGCRPNFIRFGSLPIQDSKHPEALGTLALRSAEIIERLPLAEQKKILHFLQVTEEQQRAQSS